MARPGQSVIIYTAATGSPSEEKLRILSSWSDRPIEVEERTT
jgi:hypothetical protein